MATLLNFYTLGWIVRLWSWRNWPSDCTLSCWRRREECLSFVEDDTKSVRSSVSSLEGQKEAVSSPEDQKEALSSPEKYDKGSKSPSEEDIYKWSIQ